MPGRFQPKSLEDFRRNGWSAWSEIRTKLWEMLQNPVYAGYLSAGDRLVTGNHEALIDDETWERAKEVSAGRRVQAPRTKASPHLLSSLVRCGVCNRVLVAQKARYSTSGGEKSYYAFRHSPNEFSGSRHCPGVYHRGDTLEDAVVTKILQLAQKPELMSAALSAAQEKLKDEGAPLRDEAAQITGQLAELDSRFEQWADRLDRHLIDEGQFRLHNQTLMEQKEKLARRLEEIESRLAEGEHIEVNLTQVQETLRNTPKVWENLQFEERRELLRLLIEKVAVHPDKVELHLYHLPAEPLETRRSGRLYGHKDR